MPLRLKAVGISKTNLADKNTLAIPVFFWSSGCMTSTGHPSKVDLPPILQDGGWVDIGHNSAIRLDGEELQHRVGNKVLSRPINWLRDELPLLDWILRQEKALTCDVSLIQLTT